MTAPAGSKAHTSANVDAPARPGQGSDNAITRFLGKTPVHIALIAICFIWMVPTIALLVSSFRDAQDVASTGWWTAIAPPLDFTTENYERVLTTNNLGQSFINSLFV